MAVYDVYRHTETNKYQAVKQGFCWPVFFLQSLWAFSKRLYLFGIVLTVLMVLLLAIELVISPQSFVGETAISIAQVIFYAITALYANDIRRWFLKVKGFKNVATVDAKWPSLAIAEYRDSRLNQTSVESL